MIQPAKLSDMESMLTWCNRLHKFSKQKIPFDSSTMASSLDYMISNDDSLVAINKFGLIVGGVAPSFWNFKHKVASELFIWQDTDHKDYKGEGYEMLKYYDNWAILKGVSESGITQQNIGKDLSPLFKRLGYELKEMTYSKEHI